jgi:hypothetical protein
MNNKGKYMMIIKYQEFLDLMNTQKDITKLLKFILNNLDNPEYIESQINQFISANNFSLDE